MSAQAIQLVSRAIEQRLDETLSANNIAGGVYVGPLDEQDAANAALVLFLYRIAVNADLRNAEHRVPALPPNDRPRVFEHALPLDLRYLLTVGATQTGQELEPLRILGFAIQALNDSPILAGIMVDGETTRISMDAVTSEEMSRIWQLFPTANYRTSVAYLASPVWIDPIRAPVPAPAVLQESYRFGQLESRP